MERDRERRRVEDRELDGLLALHPPRRPPPLPLERLVLRELLLLLERDLLLLPLDADLDLDLDLDPPLLMFLYSLCFLQCSCSSLSLGNVLKLPQILHE